MSGGRRLATTLALASLLVACGSAEQAPGGQRIGDYSLWQTADGLEVRSLPDQHPRLGQLLGWLHPRLGGIGAPSVLLSPVHIIDRGSLGNQTEWPRSEVASITLYGRGKRGVEAKTQSFDRSWRVLLRRRDGRALRGFGFASESDARAFAAAIGSVLGAVPQEQESGQPAG